MFCSKCGKRVDEKSNFCNYCGTKVNTQQSTKSKITRKYIRNNASKIQIILFSFGIAGKVYNVNVLEDAIKYELNILPEEGVFYKIEKMGDIICFILGAENIYIKTISEENKTIILQPINPNNKNHLNHNSISGEEFEIICATILDRNNFQNIQLTKTTGDYGIDILADKDGIKYAIQCMFYSQPVGNKAVQEAYSGKSFYNCHVAVVLTNSTFTENAIILAQNNGVLLWDRDKLNQMLETLT